MCVTLRLAAMPVVWEYTYVKAGGFGIEKLTAALNELGVEGWELVGFAPHEGIGASLAAVLKRGRRALELPGAGTPEGWLADPSGRHPDRWWDGVQWSQWMRDREGGTRLEDPPVGEIAN